jgi:DNA mismatch endonuclease (patch repair protein)
MSAVRSRNNRAELMLRHALWRRRLRYRLYDRRLVGKPDLVFASPRVVVFVDGDFWHGRVLLEHGALALRALFRTPRTDWWVQKITGNVKRDARNTAALNHAGWIVCRVWESDIIKDVETVADFVTRLVRAQRGRSGRGNYSARKSPSRKRAKASPNR